MCATVEAETYHGEREETTFQIVKNTDAEKDGIFFQGSDRQILQAMARKGIIQALWLERSRARGERVSVDGHGNTHAFDFTPNTDLESNHDLIK